MKTKMKLYFDKVSMHHEGSCSGAECDYEIEDESKTIIVDIPPEFLGKYDEEGEIPVTDKIRLKYMYEMSEERDNNYKGGLSGFCEKPVTDDQRILFMIENWVCNENTYILTKIEIVD